jgi:hypothetical protein
MSLNFVFGICLSFQLNILHVESHLLRMISWSPHSRENIKVFLVKSPRETLIHSICVLFGRTPFWFGGDSAKMRPPLLP